MLSKFKEILYFPVASYFRFFAKIRLKRWNPRIIVVTGSNGKTTALHLLESQLRGKAKFSHHANSSFGIPFDILNIHRKTLQRTEWINIILSAPKNIFLPFPKENIYVVEADADRPYEGKFLAEFLKPEVVLWVSTARTHSMNFDSLVADGSFKTVEEAIAFEYGWFIEHCKKLAIVDGDSNLEMQQIKRTKAKVKEIKRSMLQKYAVSRAGTTFEIEKQTMRFKYLLPKEVFTSVAMVKEVVEYLNLPFDKEFKHFDLPPGRGSLFVGIKNLTIIDSCYNANFSSMTAILTMFDQFPAKQKWAVIGDMLEQGKEEKEEHEKLAKLLTTLDLERIVFLGPRVKKYTLPAYEELKKKDIPIDAFENPKDVLDFLLEHIKDGETILFKGARFMEGVIEHLLKDKKDAAKLARREKIWQIRRKQWGL